MSKGLSWRQRTMLQSIAAHNERWNRGDNRPVAWRNIDYGPSSRDDVLFSDVPGERARGEWNEEQGIRRALRSLERRGLVELGRYCFEPCPEQLSSFSCDIIWCYVHPDLYVPGHMRAMTGAVLTEAGRAFLAGRCVELEAQSLAKAKAHIAAQGLDWATLQPLATNA